MADHNEIRDQLPSHVDEDYNPALAESVAAAIGAAVAAGVVDALSTAVGRVYTRKTEQVFDSLGGPRNQSYGSETDDYYIQIGIRVPYYEVDGPLKEHLSDIEEIKKDERLADVRERRVAAQAHLARAKDAWDALVAEETALARNDA